MKIDLSVARCVCACQISERFLGTWQGRGDRSVFVTSHRPVHCCVATLVRAVVLQVFLVAQECGFR